MVLQSLVSAWEKLITWQIDTNRTEYKYSWLSCLGEYQGNFPTRSQGLWLEWALAKQKDPGSILAYFLSLLVK